MMDEDMFPREQPLEAKGREQAGQGQAGRNPGLSVHEQDAYGVVPRITESQSPASERIRRDMLPGLHAAPMAGDWAGSPPPERARTELNHEDMLRLGPIPSRQRQSQAGTRVPFRSMSTRRATPIFAGCYCAKIDCRPKRRCALKKWSTTSAMHMSTRSRIVGRLPLRQKPPNALGTQLTVWFALVFKAKRFSTTSGHHRIGVFDRHVWFDAVSR